MSRECARSPGWPLTPPVPRNPLMAHRKIREDKLEADWHRVAIGDYSPENFHLLTDDILTAGARRVGSPSRHLRRPACCSAPLRAGRGRSAHASATTTPLAADWEPWKFHTPIKTEGLSGERLANWVKWMRRNRWRPRGDDDVVTRGGVWSNGGRPLPSGRRWEARGRYARPRGGNRTRPRRDVDGPVWPVFARQVRRKVPVAEVMRARQPGARLMVSLRSPPERTASHYFMMCNQRCAKTMDGAENKTALQEARDRCGFARAGPRGLRSLLHICVQYRHAANVTPDVCPSRHRAAAPALQGARAGRGQLRLPVPRRQQVVPPNDGAGRALPPGALGHVRRTAPPAAPSARYCRCPRPRAEAGG